MDSEFYLEKFKQSADKLDKHHLQEKQLEVSVGIVLDSVYLKLYKRRWTSDLANPLHAEARIFFSIWVNDKTLRENKVFYNIHALKLRKLSSYSVLSREFADDFRERFAPFKTDWTNVRTNLGPLTLMEGWSQFNSETLERIIITLASNFSTIDHLIDETLKEFEE
jgi:hypothetical protein